MAMREAEVLITATIQYDDERYILRDGRLIRRWCGWPSLPESLVPVLAMLNTEAQYKSDEMITLDNRHIKVVEYHTTKME